MIGKVLFAWLMLPPAMAVAQPATDLTLAERQQALRVVAPSFGRLDPARGCILARVRAEGSDTSACLAIVKTKRIGEVVHLALSGKGKMDCHACTGLVGFAVLSTSSPGWKVEAAGPAYSSGSYGAPTAARDITFTHLGRDRWGWIEEGGAFGQGVLEGGFTIYARRDRQVAEAGRLPGGLDNMGACVDGKVFDTGPCVAVKAGLTPDASDPAAEGYPLKLTYAGKAGRRAVREQRTARYDPASQAWIAPEMPAFVP